MEKKRAFGMILSRGVIVAGENSTVLHVSNLMVEENIGAVVIIRGEKVVGIVSERDIVRRVVHKNLSSKKTKAKDIMTTNVVTAEFKDGLDKIYQTLCNVKFRHLPITDNGDLVGMASQRDVLYSLTPKGNSSSKTSKKT
ncbi:MAG: CBS domain-containing protein [Candidatus Omnitrophica bacterium]|nr:CBS domain-containing protein [Candidatus Omnitrophota bacterium]